MIQTFSYSLRSFGRAFATLILFDCTWGKIVSFIYNQFLLVYHQPFAGHFFGSTSVCLALTTNVQSIKIQSTILIIYHFNLSFDVTLACRCSPELLMHRNHLLLLIIIYTWTTSPQSGTFSPTLLIIFKSKCLQIEITECITATAWMYHNLLSCSTYINMYMHIIILMRSRHSTNANLTHISIGKYLLNFHDYIGKTCEARNFSIGDKISWNQYRISFFMRGKSDNVPVPLYVCFRFFKSLCFPPSKQIYSLDMYYSYATISYYSECGMCAWVSVK